MSETITVSSSDFVVFGSNRSPKTIKITNLDFERALDVRIRIEGANGIATDLKPDLIEFEFVEHLEDTREVTISISADTFVREHVHDSLIHVECKIRFAANEGNLIRPKYNSYFHACRTIAKIEGIRGFYQGLIPNLVAAPLSWGLYFHIYHKIHKRFSNDSDPNKQSFLFNFVNGFVSGFIVLAGTNPLWVTKTRLCLQYEASTKQYNGMVDCLRKIYKAEGIRGWYRGFTPGLFGNVNGSLQFALYNFLKDWRCSSKKLPLDHKLGTTDYLIFSSISKIISVLTTYPYQVIRTRLQDHNASYKNMRDCILQTWRREGLRGMYKGSLVAALKQTPAGVITYVVYEHSRRFVEKL